MYIYAYYKQDIRGDNGDNPVHASWTSSQLRWACARQVGGANAAPPHTHKYEETLW
jgi:hypothetical protein